MCSRCLSQNTSREEKSDTDGVKQSRSCQQFGVLEGDAFPCNTRFHIPFFFFQESFMREHKYLKCPKWKQQEMVFLFLFFCCYLLFSRKLLLPRLNWCGRTRTSLEDFAEEFLSTFKCYDSPVVPKSFISLCPGTLRKKELQYPNQFWKMDFSRVPCILKRNVNP